MTTVTLSSVGTSNSVAADWIGSKPTTIAVSLGSTTMTADFTIQYTLDDLQRSTSPVWFALSSEIGSSAQHFSAAVADTGVTVGLLYPVAGLRLSSTAISSSSLTLRVIQGIGG